MPKPPIKTTAVDLDKMTPENLARLVMAATLRSKLTQPNGVPSLQLFTTRKHKGRKVLMLGHSVFGKMIAQPARIEGPAGSVFVRVWAGDVWQWMLRRHSEVAKGTELATLATLGSDEGPERNREKVEELIEILERKALEPEAPKPDVAQKAYQDRSRFSLNGDDLAALAARLDQRKVGSGPSLIEQVPASSPRETVVYPASEIEALPFPRQEAAPAEYVDADDYWAGKVMIPGWCPHLQSGERTAEVHCQVCPRGTLGSHRRPA